jgi:ubiquinone biosynthesis protein UbiJ
MLASFETLINKALALDAASTSQVKSLTGKCITIENTSLHFTFFITVIESQLRLQSIFEGTPDTTLKGSTKAFMSMLMSRDKTVAMLANDIEIIGDANCAQTLQTIFSELEIDWEAQLSNITGGIVAHEISNIARTVNNWSKNAFSHFASDIKEYMDEEAPFKTPRGKVDDYLNEIDELKLRIDRMDAHITRLNEQLRKFSNGPSS